MSIERFPIVEIDWLDACRSGGWSSLDYYKKRTLAKCRTTGYLINKDRKHVTVMQSLGSDVDGTDGITIPRSNIQKMRILKKGRK